MEYEYKAESRGEFYDIYLKENPLLRTARLEITLKSIYVGT